MTTISLITHSSLSTKLHRMCNKRCPVLSERHGVSKCQQCQPPSLLISSFQTDTTSEVLVKSTVRELWSEMKLIIVNSTTLSVHRYSVCVRVVAIERIVRGCSSRSLLYRIVLHITWTVCLGMVTFWGVRWILNWSLQTGNCEGYPAADRSNFLAHCTRL